MPMQNEITTPVQPRLAQNGRDLRPANDIIANPIEGHDYSYHPQAQQIREGLAMRRINSGQPAAGMRIGTQGPATSQPAGNVGVANAYTRPTQPTPGREYSDEEAGHLSTQGWGRGEISMGGGPAVHVYSNPAATQAHDAQVHAQMANDRLNRQRQQTLTGIDSSIQALMNEYYGGRASMDQVANAHASLGQYAGAYLGNDAAHAQAAASRQQHFDPRQNPDFMRASINQMNASAERDRAEADNHNPQRKLDMADRLGNSPGLAETTGALQSNDPAAIEAAARHNRARQQIGINGVNRENVGDYIGLPEHKPFADVVNDQTILPMERLVRALNMEGASDPASHHRQAIDALVHQLWPTQQHWQDALDSLPNIGPGQTAMGSWAGSLNEKVLGPVASLWANMIGTPIGTGHWQQNHDLYQRFMQAWQRTGYSPSY